jgi:lysophospholipase L1-like esterase
MDSWRDGEQGPMRSIVIGAALVISGCTSEPSTDAGIEPPRPIDAASSDASRPNDSSTPLDALAMPDATVIEVPDATVIEMPDAASPSFEPCPATGPCYVMALGDSITAGYLSSDGSGYLRELRDRADGLAMEYVGTRVNSGGRNEGHSGWVIQQVRDQIDTFVSTCTDASGATRPPNVVLLMIGTNDTNGMVALDSAPARLDDLLERLVYDLPEALIVVAQIIPNGNASVDSTAVASFNGAIPALVAARAGAGQHIAMVDMHAALAYPDDFGDSVHPNDSGFAKMAAVWFAALGPHLRPR